MAGVFTAINPPHPGEDSHQQILSRIYGGTFSSTPERGVDFTNGSTTAFRIDDRVDAGLWGAPGDPTEMSGPTGGEDETDQTWQANFIFATAEAKFASYAQNFGYFNGTTGGSYTQLFALSGSQYDVSGEADLSSLAGRILRWGRGGQNRIVSSKITDNADNEDHMVTYQIMANPTRGEASLRWLVFWEDILRGEPFEDFDFNDLVVEITANAIPEPAFATACGLLCLLALRRRR
jgi:hypothetical protein